MSENVIILGAGASYEAGIPLMKDFMDRMWMIAKLGRLNGDKLKDEDRKLITDALAIRDELDSYHGRASIKVWNLEDVLSLLSLNALAGGKGEKRKLEVMTQAIAKTIELTCQVKHDGSLGHGKDQDGQVHLYSNFWYHLIQWAKQDQLPLPTIITFNYDLVLERSLLHILEGTTFYDRDAPGRRGFPWKGIELNYRTKLFPPQRFNLDADRISFFDESRMMSSYKDGFVLKWQHPDAGRPTNLGVDLVKLHGSANFPRPKRGRPNEWTPGKRITTALDDPLILPPVFNKATETVGSDAWAFALKALRQCKNLIVCGYSLPQTDTYMQYFLKASLGPNRDLNHIYVFDPVLFDKERQADGEQLRSRYNSIFAESIQERIVYQPTVPSGLGSFYEGKFVHVVELLHRAPERLLFG